MATVSVSAARSDVDGAADGDAVAREHQQAAGPKLGFIGAGMMATAMINGIVAAKVNRFLLRFTHPPDCLTAVSPDKYLPSLWR